MQTLQEIMTQFYREIDIKKIKKLKNKTILITGASGLIGSNIIAFLSYLNKKNNLNVKIIGIIRSHIEPWHEQDKNIIYKNIDLSKNIIRSDFSFDYLIHCATYAQPKKFLQYPKETVLLNIKTLFDLLDLCKKNNATMLFLSSAEIYGEADKQHTPTEESYYGYVNTLSERAIYAESKRLAETICYLYNKTIDIKIARLLICYGPGVKIDDQRVYCEFIKKAQDTGEIIMTDEGLAQRTLCFITDAIEMLLNILLNSKEIVYNVSGVETISIRRLAKIIAEINKAKVSNKIKRAEIKGTPQRSTLSNIKYMNEFNKKKFVSLEEGLKTTSLWFKNLRNTV